MSSARQLREGREAAHSSRTRPPDLIQRSVIASFMASGGDLGNVICMAVHALTLNVLWNCSACCTMSRAATCTLGQKCSIYMHGSASAARMMAEHRGYMQLQMPLLTCLSNEDNAVIAVCVCLLCIAAAYL